jgi:hypothetical protein
VVFAGVKAWVPVVPLEAWAGGLAAALVVGGLAGLLPALRAADVADGGAAERLRNVGGGASRLDRWLYLEGDFLAVSIVACLLQNPSVLSSGTTSSSWSARALPH